MSIQTCKPLFNFGKHKKNIFFMKSESSLIAAAPREHLRVWCLAQGFHLSCGIEGGRVLVIHSPHQQFLPNLRLEPATFGLQVRLSIHQATTSMGGVWHIPHLVSAVYGRQEGRFHCCAPELWAACSTTWIFHHGFQGKKWSSSTALDGVRARHHHYGGPQLRCHGPWCNPACC